MAKFILIAAALLFSISAMAKSECYLYLTNAATAAPMTDEQLELADLWMKAQDATLHPTVTKERAAENIFGRLAAWKALTAAQRDQALALEILKISPRSSSTQTLISLTGKKQFVALSAQNQERMLRHLATSLNISPKSLKSPALNKLVNRLASKITLIYGRPAPSTPQETRLDEVSFVSPRELSALGLIPPVDFHSDLIGTSPSVEFATLIMGSTKSAKTEVATILKQETMVLKANVAEEYGMVLPRVSTVAELLNFFEFWDPAAAEEVFRANWNSLPVDVRRYDQFRAYFEIQQDEIFPHDKLFERLAPLRTRLIQYAMTTADAQGFVKQAFRLYIFSMVEEDPEAGARLEEMMENSAAILPFFRDEFFPFLHLTAGMSLRIPIAVSAKQVELSQVEKRVSPRRPPASYDGYSRQPFLGRHAPNPPPKL